MLQFESGAGGRRRGRAAAAPWISVHGITHWVGELGWVPGAAPRAPTGGRSGRGSDGYAEGLAADTSRVTATFGSRRRNTGAEVENKGPEWTAAV